MLWSKWAHHLTNDIRSASSAARGSLRLGHIRSHGSFTHITSPRKPTVCFIWGWLRRQTRT